MVINEEMLKRMKLRLLEPDEVGAEKPLSVLDKYGLKAQRTDMALLTGIYETTIVARRDKPGDYFINLRESNYVFTPLDAWYSACYISREGFHDSFYTPELRSRGVRPVLELPEDLFEEAIKDRREIADGVYETDLGEYTLTIPSPEIIKELDKKLETDKLEPTGKSITLDGIRPKKNWPFQPVKAIEYEYEGKKYVRVKVNSYDQFISIRYSSRTFKQEMRTDRPDMDQYYMHFGRGGYAWVQVLPVPWLIDFEKKLLVSKYILLAGIKNTGNGLDHCEWESTEMKKFFDRYLLRDLFIPAKSKEEEKETAKKPVTKTDEINGLIIEIYNLLQYVPNNKSIVEEVEGLIDDYRKKIKAVHSDTNLLKLDSEVSVYRELITGLSTILDRVKVISERYKKYYEMLELTENCVKMIDEPEKVEETPKDDLEKDIYKVVKKVFPFLEDDPKYNSLKYNLRSIFALEEGRIRQYINAKYGFDIEDYQTMEEFKLYIRTKLQPFFADLDEKAHNSEILKRIRKGYDSVIKGTYEGERVEHITRVLNSMQQVINEIKERGNEEENKRLKELLKEDIVTGVDLPEAAKKVKKIFMDIYGILIDIDDRLSKEAKYKDYLFEDSEVDKIPVKINEGTDADMIPRYGRLADYDESNKFIIDSIPDLTDDEMKEIMSMLKDSYTYLYSQDDRNTVSKK